jgi:hypothetical protein
MEFIGSSDSNRVKREKETKTVAQTPKISSKGGICFSFTFHNDIVILNSIIYQFKYLCMLCFTISFFYFCSNTVLLLN